MASSTAARSLLSSFASTSSQHRVLLSSRQFCSSCRSGSKITIDNLGGPSLPSSTILQQQRAVFQRRFNSSDAATSTTSTASSSGSRNGPNPNSSARQNASRNAYYAQRNKSLLLYTSAVLVLGVGVTYAAVPLYRIFCSATGYGGTPMTSGSAGTDPNGQPYGLGRFAAEKLIPFYGDSTKGQKERRIKVTFNADCSDALPWKFTPLQKSVVVRPGESALAFYTATNKSDKDIIGIATYNVTPNNVAPYFAKVECFCFEEQRLLAGEEVDLPILFFIDRDLADDPTMRDVDNVVLSYTFFRAKRDSYGNLVPDNSPATA